jgi:superfamily II DNA or RNA helicase
VIPYTPHDDQRKAIDFIKSTKHVLLKAPTGAGKTLVGVQTALELEAKTILCIGPINTESGWRSHVERQYQGTMPFHYINNKRVAGRKAFQAINDKVPGFYFVGREYFRQLAWKKVKVDFIIFDECHAATNRNSIMFRILKTAKAPYQLAMSATPAGNHMQGLWTLARWLWPQHTELGFLNWATQWFHTEENPHATYKIGEQEVSSTTVTTEREPGKLWKSLPAAWKMPSVYKDKPTVHWIEVDISREQRKHYKDLEDEAITWLNDHPLAVDIPAVLNMRLRQICLAVPSVRQDWVRKKDKETGLWMDQWGDVVWFEEDAKSSKIDTVIELLTDIQAGEEVEPVVIFTDSRIFAQILVQRLQKKKFNARQFIGGMSKEERDWKKLQFGKEFDVIVCTIPSVAEGLDGWQLVSNHAIWVNVSYNQLLNVQADGRLNRQGQTKPVQNYFIVAKDTVEVKQHGKIKNTQQLLDYGYSEEEEEVA